jgi:hypothetical protein
MEGPKDIDSEFLASLGTLASGSPPDEVISSYIAHISSHTSFVDNKTLETERYTWSLIQEVLKIPAMREVSVDPTLSEANRVCRLIQDNDELMVALVLTRWTESIYPFRGVPEGCVLDYAATIN